MIQPQQIPSFLLKEPVKVTVVGAGGNGSHFINGLARLHMSLVSLGHPGFEVDLWDDDKVTESNVGRQLFSPSDIGQYKAAVLINRINAFYGMGWSASIGRWSRNIYNRDILVGCVDSRKARAEIASTMEHMGRNEYFWLDLGNTTTTGQYVLGQALDKKKRTAFRMPTVAELFPDSVDLKVADDDAPSCSLAAALGRQDLFINQAVSTGALNLLWRWFRTGSISFHGGFVNLETGKMTTLDIDPDVWARLGFRIDKMPPWRKIKKIISHGAYMRRGVVKLSCGHTVESDGQKRARCIECHKQGIYE